MAVFHQNVILPFCFILQIPQTTVDTIINQENDPCFDSRHQAQHNRFVRGVTHFPFKQALVVNKAEGNDSNLLIVFYVQIMPDDFVMQLHRF